MKTYAFYTDQRRRTSVQFTYCSKAAESDFFDVWLDLYQPIETLTLCKPDTGTDARKRDQLRLAIDMWCALFQENDKAAPDQGKPGQDRESSQRERDEQRASA